MLCCGCDYPQKLPQNTSKLLRLCFEYEPITIDPRKNSDPVSCRLINMLYEGLVHLEPDGSVSLGLAQSIDISTNLTRYTIHLKNALWSNGEPITAYDIEHSWKSLLSPDFNSVNAYFLYPIHNAHAAKIGKASLDDVGIYAQDPNTLIIDLEHPTSHFLKMLAFVTFLPISKNADLESKEHTQPVFSGPFLLQEWKHNDSLTLKKNPFFWDASHVLLDTIHISIISDSNTALQLYQQGEIDWLENPLENLSLAELSNVYTTSTIHSVDDAATTMCFFNLQCFPFNNAHIRKAFAYAIEKEPILEYLCQGIPAYGVIPPLLKEGKCTKIIPVGSQTLARHYFELGLKETGLSKETFPLLTFSTYTSSLQKNLALTLQQQWYSTLGVRTSIETSDIKIFLDKLYKKNYQFALMSIKGQYFDPMNFLERFISPLAPKNFSGWEHMEFPYLTAIIAETTEPEERCTLIEAAESLIMQDAPVAPIYHQTSTYMSHHYVQGVQVSPVGLVDFRYTDLQNNPHN